MAFFVAVQFLKLLKNLRETGGQAAQGKNPAGIQKERLFEAHCGVAAQSEGVHVEALYKGLPFFYLDSSFGEQRDPVPDDGYVRGGSSHIDYYGAGDVCQVPCPHDTGCGAAEKGFYG